MTEPRPTRLAPDLRALLASERSAAGPSPDARERVRGRLAATLGIPAGSLTASPPSGSAPGTSAAPSSPQAPAALSTPSAGSSVAAGGAATGGAGLLSASKLLFVLGALAAGGVVVGTLYPGSSPEPPSATAPAPVPGASRPTRPSVLIPPVPLPESPPAESPSARKDLSPDPPPSPAASTVASASLPRRSRQTPVRPRPQPRSRKPRLRPTTRRPIEAPEAAQPAAPSPSAPREGGLEAERRLLDRARRALGQGESSAALAALTRHAERFPSGELVEERRALHVMALAKSGQAAKARTEAARFRNHYPRSILLPAVRAAAPAPPAEVR